jgi:hypothetical protein
LRPLVDARNRRRFPIAAGALQPSVASGLATEILTDLSVAYVGG